ncbi:hypothetical protein [Nonomuraea candida]|uniref:hypothetical protein n=1 Tax=Nonomuraea candida TaxID=359159 RepID=UPI000694790B|nr:hypothetical protein [Nonomuraea candida]
MNSPEPFDDLEAELLALGDLLDLPAPPPATVAATVRTRLEHPTPDPDPTTPDPAGSDPAVPGSAPGRRDGGRRGPVRRGRRRRWAVVVAVIVAVVAVTAATPQGRAAVMAVLRFAGIELQMGRSTPPPVTATATLPGETPVSMAELPARAGFPVRTLAALDPPHRVTVSEGGRVVSMFWPDGLRFDQFDGAVEPYFFKQVGPPFPDFTRLNGREALWMSGEHPVGYIRREDGTRVPLRQAAPTLIWWQDDLNFRLEGARTMEEAVRVASSLQ